MSNLDWTKLRLFDGSLQTGFEKLCCQLAQDTKPPFAKNFIAKGDGGDAGVECFWILENGDEYAWQAKFFLKPPDASQWDQIDKSIKVALAKHPRLIKYTICLPIDRSDARVKGKNSFLDTWNLKVKTWEGWATKLNRTVEFEYCGQHEIFTWLSNGQRGRFFYWFHQEYFDDEWFRKNLKYALDIAGPRYTPNHISNPELNLQLDIAGLFEGLGRTTEFFKKIHEKHLLLDKSSLVFRRISTENPQANQDTEHPLNFEWQSLSEILFEVYQNRLEKLIPFDILSKKLNELVDNCSAAEANLDDKTESNKYLRYDLQSFRVLLQSLQEDLISKPFQLANCPVLALLGDAGSGKTHLFCDVAKHRLDQGLPTVLLLGEQFQRDISWQALVNELQVSCTADEFLEALNTIGQVRQSKVLIMIDALNESNNYLDWESRLVQFISKIEDYSYLALAISIRVPYDKILLRQDLVEKQRLIKEYHMGFSGYEYEASHVFFQHYNIPEPNIPLLHPEFSNPLFLKLFCEAFQGSKLDNIKGIVGITRIFDRFLEAVNNRLAKPDVLDFDPNQHIVHAAVKSIIKAIIKHRDTRIPIIEAQKIVNDVYSLEKGYSHSLYRYLLSEGIITEVPVWENNQPEKRVRFAYERFSDHLIAEEFLNTHLDLINPATSFQKGTPLHDVLTHEDWSWLHSNLIPAFAIQVPERTGMELFELVPSLSDHWEAPQAFLDSLIWRRWTDDKLSEELRDLINGKGFPIDDSKLFETLISLAVDTETPLNANFLHRNLIDVDMPDRDSHWGILMHEIFNYSEHNAIDRLINWAWTLPAERKISSEALFLSGTMLAWFLISSNRLLRDQATKALINLYSTRLKELIPLIERFLTVNDLYVLERIFAVAYGCAMRCEDDDHIRYLAEHVYGWIFSNGNIPAHILLRDYARGVLELALYKDPNLSVDRSLIQPPYKSNWIEEPLPLEDLEDKYEWRDENMSDDEYSRLTIVRSVTHIDFGVYIIDPSVSKWSYERLDTDKLVPPNQKLKDFESQLSDVQKEAWEKYRRGTWQFIIPSLDSGPDSLEPDNDVVTEDIDIIRGTLEQNNVDEKTFIETQERYRRDFINKLNPDQLLEFTDVIEPFLAEEQKAMQIYREATRFPVKLAMRWILQRVFDLGWTVERFGEFDRRVNRRHIARTSNQKPERVGKKYQWLAFYEFLARVADNYHFKGEAWIGEADSLYQGTWQIYGRNIDPSHIIKRIAKKNWNSNQQNWWFNLPYNDWNMYESLIDWVKSNANLPDIKSLITVINPKTLEKMVALEATYEWEQTSLFDELKPRGRGTVRLHVKSYIVKKEHIDEMFEWALKQDYWNNWMPDLQPLYMPDTYLGEMFWSPAFSYHRSNQDEWCVSELWPHPMLLATDGYTQEETYDGSIDGLIHITLPSRWLAEKLNLTWSPIKGEEKFFYNDKCVMFDPAVKEDGPNALLLEKSHLLHFIATTDYDIFWTVVGDKMIIGEDMWTDKVGYTRINGAYRLLNGNIVGSIRGEFQDYGDEPEDIR